MSAESPDLKTLIVGDCIEVQSKSPSLPYVAKVTEKYDEGFKTVRIETWDEHAKKWTGDHGVFLGENAKWKKVPCPDAVSAGRRRTRRSRRKTRARKSRRYRK